MKYKARHVFFLALTAVCLAGSIGWTSGSLSDRESSIGNVFTSWTSTLWKQATQQDFAAGVLNSVDISSSGNVTLAANCTSGTIASRVLDTGIPGTRWDALFWDETLPISTNVTFEVRASDALFGANETSPSWASPEAASPIISGLPSGRYKQWKATLSTSDISRTPVLSDVRVYYH